MTSIPLSISLSIRSCTTSTLPSAGLGEERQFNSPLPSRPRVGNCCDQKPLPPPPEGSGLAGAATAQRCSEKGCVFPAAGSDTGKCRQHLREHREPALFSSVQPSTLLLDRAKFGLPDSDSEPQVSRSSDRRRLTKLRRAFLEGAA